jgi:cytochrome c oxidase assembly protein subunit 15
MSAIANEIETAPRAASNRPIGLWLLACAAMIFAMAVIGAITRLTESGLSIMEWAPLRGALPPIGDAEWQRLFELYRQIPEYRQENAGMSLEDFKTIFWWEWVHRLWGRLIGVVFALPFFWFLARRRIAPALKPHLFAMLLLGGLQGALGWYMVASGFADRTDVSQYRLVAHLGLAVAIYGYILWIALRLIDLNPQAGHDPRQGRLRAALVGLLCLAGLTMASGGFVAGLNAGLIYNTFPLMDGRLIPDGYAPLQPFVVNFFETVETVQFNHRLLAVATLAASVAVWAWSLRLDLSAGARKVLNGLLAMAGVQFALGIATLLLVVPVWLGALHQAGALALISAILWSLHRLRAPTARRVPRHAV